MTGSLSRQTAGRWVFPALVVIAVLAGYAGATRAAPLNVWIFVLVLAGWVISLCLHEFAHAATALAGGDIAVRTRGYLTLNPFRYLNAAYSIVIPVIILIAGGIPLPGGAVLIENHRLRKRWWSSLVSLAGPATNFILGVILLYVANSLPREYIGGIFAPNGLYQAIAFPGPAAVRHRDPEHPSGARVRRLRHHLAVSLAGHPTGHRTVPRLGPVGGVRDPVLHSERQFPRFSSRPTT